MLDPKWSEPDMVEALEELEEVTRGLLHLDGSRCRDGGCALPHVREGDCAHSHQIPHVTEGGRWRWTCSDCYLALPMGDVR